MQPETNIYKGNIKVLFMTTFAFFITFVVWFNMAPFASTIKEVMGLTTQQIKILAVINVALTIPARIVIGMLVDKFGPRITYTALLSVLSIPCFAFALGTTFAQLFIARMFLGVIGAGFVIGIKMVGEWFPAKQIGTAQGVYGGWGNFGSAASAFALPLLAIWFFGGVEDGWRYSIGLTGVLSLVYSVIYYKSVSDAPEGVTLVPPKKSGALEVSSYKDMFMLIAMTFPLYLTLIILVWKLTKLSLISAPYDAIIYVALIGIYLFNVRKIRMVNNDHLRDGVKEEDSYKFKQVAILDFAYLVTFGSELAVVSMLPTYFRETFEMSVQNAGMIAASFAFMNLVARPGGGWLSDKFGRQKTLSILMAGLTISYFVLSQVDGNWPILLVLATTMITSFFVQAGEGSVFSIVPLVKKRLTGQIAGMVGAYGNTGAVIFLTALTFISTQSFFLLIASFAAVCFFATLMLKDPKVDVIAEV